MATTISTPRTTRLPTHWSLADIQNHLGGIPIHRIRSFPPPGLATVEDAETLTSRKEAICELIDGILVEKPMGYYESFLAVLIITKLTTFVVENKLGIVLGEAGTLRILPDQVRIPDVCFIGWSRIPEGRLPREPIPELVPDLAIEILSDSNTPGEMDQKRQDFFQAGVRLVWYIDPPTRSATVYCSSEDPGTRHAESEPLIGGDVLPDFSLSLAEIFQQADIQMGQ